MDVDHYQLLCALKKLELASKLLERCFQLHWAGLQRVQGTLIDKSCGLVEAMAIIDDSRAHTIEYDISHLLSFSKNPINFIQTSKI